MNALSLKECKESLRQLDILFDEYLKHDDLDKSFPMYRVLAITLHNMSHDSSDCVNYDHDREVQKMYSSRKLFNSFASFYPQHYTILWIKDEIDMAITYADMNEIYE